MNIPGIVLTGKHDKWGHAFQDAFNAYMKEWNAKTDFAWDRIINAGRYSDRPIQYVGGAGDPFGIWEVGGMALSAGSGGKGNYILAGLMMIRSGNIGTTLNLLNAEKGLLIQANQKKDWLKQNTYSRI